MVLLYTFIHVYYFFIARQSWRV